jgi:hypothetical protein
MTNPSATASRNLPKNTITASNLDQHPQKLKLQKKKRGRARQTQLAEGFARKPLKLVTTRNYYRIKPT